VVDSAAGSLSSNENGVDYGLKHSILDKDNGLFLSVNYHEFTCGQKVVRCVSIA